MSERPDDLEPVPDDAEFPAQEDDEKVLPEDADKVINPLEDEEGNDFPQTI